MTVLELIHSIEQIAQEYRPEAIKSIKRNTHLHDCKLEDIGKQDFVDAILSDFVNFLASKYHVDYGTHAYDIYWPDALKEWKRIEELQHTDLGQYEREKDNWEKKKEEYGRHED